LHVSVPRPECDSHAERSVRDSRGDLQPDPLREVLRRKVFDCTGSASAFSAGPSLAIFALSRALSAAEIVGLLPVGFVVAV
jgi:hypothetical protein